MIYIDSVVFPFVTQPIQRFTFSCFLCVWGWRRGGVGATKKTSFRMIMLQDGHYVGQQQDDQGYQSSLSSPNESQMKRSGLVFLRISEVAQLKFAFQATFKSKATLDCSEGGGPFQPEPAGIIARFSIFILSKKC